MKNIFYPFLSFVFLTLSPLVAFAHGFGERIDLPIPLNLYLIGAGAAVAVSFLLIGFISRTDKPFGVYPRYNLLQIAWIKKLFESERFLTGIKVSFVLLLLLVVIAGFIGKQVSAFNIAPTVVWILFGVGMVYVSAFVGNVWSCINPWKSMFGWAEKVSPKLSLETKWPQQWSVWPAVLFIIIYRWVENIYPESADPQILSLLIVFYTLITFSGMLYFGKLNWLRFGDPFSVFFRYLSYFSIFETRTVNGKRELSLRFPATGLLEDRKVDAAQMVFVLFMLSSVAFDGALSTPLWQSMNIFLLQNGSSSMVAGTLGLLTLLGIFVSVYFFFSLLVKFFSRSVESVYTLAYKFVFSLLPIAIAYEVAHFASLLSIEGQRIIYLVSDPFGFGWNLFNTALYKINFGIINLKVLWNVQVVLIIVGHIVAVYIAHVVASHFFQDRKIAMRSQYPMLVLMVLYTVFSLWIIAQPIVVGA